MIRGGKTQKNLNGDVTPSVLILFLCSCGAELPAFGGKVYLQLSCTVTLMAWVMIPLFNTLTVSQLSLANARAVGVSLSSL